MAKVAIMFPFKFLSTPSARRATTPFLYFFPVLTSFLSTPSARRATEILKGYQSIQSHFYPRPPRGGRLLQDFRLETIRCISIHALREEGDTYRYVAGYVTKNFYPRPPRGGRH